MKGHQEKIKEQDYMAWLSNQYTLSAVSTAIEHNLAGKKAKSKYIKEPLLLKAFRNSEFTDEQMQEKEIRKAMLIEQQYMAIAIAKGLPETIVK